MVCIFDKHVSLEDCLILQMRLDLLWKLCKSLLFCSICFTYDFEDFRLYNCFLNLLLSGKNNSSNIANTASSTTNTVVNTAAGVEDLNIIQVTIPGVYTVSFHITFLVLTFFMTFVSSVGVFLQSSWFTVTQVQSTKSII